MNKTDIFKSVCITCNNPKIAYKNLCLSCYRKDRYPKDRKRILNYHKKKRLENPEYFKNTDRKKYLKKQLSLGKEPGKPRDKKSTEHKKLVRRNISMKYWVKKLNAQPTWVDIKEIKKIYMECPDGYQVDHIVPLQGKTVSGLHVPWNLQYLTAEENQKKSNKLILP